MTKWIRRLRQPDNSWISLRRVSPSSRGSVTHMELPISSGSFESSLLTRTCKSPWCGISPELCLRQCWTWARPRMFLFQFGGWNWLSLSRKWLSHAALAKFGLGTHGKQWLYLTWWFIILRSADFHTLLTKYHLVPLFSSKTSVRRILVTMLKRGSTAQHRVIHQNNIASSYLLTFVVLRSFVLLLSRKPARAAGRDVLKCS